MEERRMCISVLEMGDRLGVSRTTAYQLARSKGFPVVKIGQRTLVSVEGLERWVKEHTGGGVELPE